MATFLFGFFPFLFSFLFLQIPVLPKWVNIYATRVNSHGFSMRQIMTVADPGFLREGGGGEGGG